MAYRAIFYDTETTGISTSGDRIIELAAFDPDRNTTFSRLINPGCSIPADATAIHHITNEMVSEAPSFAVIGQEFIDFCDGDVILVAHNNDTFDFPFMKHEFTRNGLPMPHWKSLDTLKWARRYRPDLPKHSLQVLRELYGIPANNAHRALDDVIVLYQVFTLMADDLTIDEAYSLLNQPRSIQHMPFGKYQGKLLSEVPKDYLIWLTNSGAFDKTENHQLRSSFEALGLLSVSARS